MFLNKHFDSVLAADSIKRPGSAPPQLDELLSAGSFPSGSFTNFLLGSHAPQIASFPDPREESSVIINDSYRADPAYIKYYYANKNINPRLPPPIISREAMQSVWDKGVSEPQILSDRLDGKEDALQALLSAQLSLHMNSDSTASCHSFQQALGSQSTRQGSSFNSPSKRWAQPANDLLDEIALACSPNQLNSLLQSELKRCCSPCIFPSDDNFSESIFGSAPHTPGHASFDGTVLSPRHSDSPRISSSFTDMKPNLANFIPSAPREVTRLGPSKLRLGSHADVFDESYSAPNSYGSGQHSIAAISTPLGSTPDAMKGMVDALQNFTSKASFPNVHTQTSESLSNGHASKLASNGIPNGSSTLDGYGQHDFPGIGALGAAPGMNGMPGMVGGAGFPGADPGLLGMPGPVPSPQHMHAMYMAAAMYPYYAQQNVPFSAAMQAASMYRGAFMPPNFSGYPLPPPLFNPLLPPMYGAQNGGMPNVHPHFPAPGHMPPEYAAYYRQAMEAKAGAEHAGQAASKGAEKGNDYIQADFANGNGQRSGQPRNSQRRNSPLKERRARMNSRDPLNRRGPERPSNLSGNSTVSASAGGMNGAANGGANRLNRRDDGQGARSGSAAAANGTAASDRRPDPLLEEFKTSKTRTFELPDIAGHVYEFSLDQHGSRFIQQQLEVVFPVDLAAAFNEVLPRCLSLMTDVFGNYVVQKFLEHGGEDVRKSVAEVIRGHVLSLSLQMYGCRVIQKAVELLPLDMQIDIVHELDGHIMRCVRDQNGNHVIQKCIECVPSEHIALILDQFMSCVVTLSMHPFGCRVIQRILEHCQDAEKRDHVMQEILKSTSQLAQDQYGNYVVQHVLEHGEAEERMRAIRQLAPQIVDLSLHKFASNVVEKCLTHCTHEERTTLIAGLISEGEGETDPLQQLMKDQFGNYVVQRVLEVCDESQRQALLARLRAHLATLRKYTYGKHIVARVEKLLGTDEGEGGSVGDASTEDGAGINGTAASISSTSSTLVKGSSD